MRIPWVAWFVLLVAAGCVSGQVDHSPRLGNGSHSIVDDNGIDLNGLMANGLMQNGLTLNGAQLNGAQLNGAQLNGFSINGLSLDESLNVMKYLVKCALADYQTMTINVDGSDYSWPGALGLAPEWADGPLTDEVSQFRVSGCLMALANADGQSQPISVRGDLLPYDFQEVQDYSVPEAVFFGNLFWDPPSAYGCAISASDSDRDYLRSIGRRCAMPGNIVNLLTECNFGLFRPCQTLCPYVDAIDAGSGGYFNCSSAGSITVYDQNY